MSADAFPDPAPVTTAYLATGASFADALSAGAAAVANGGPVVLTTPDTLSDEARDELRRLQPDRVVVVGGTVAVSRTVVEQVADDAAISAAVERIGGETRFDTAADVVEDAFPGTSDVVFVATGRSFPDALSGVPAAARYDAPLLLTEQGTLPPATRDAISRLQPRRVVILGGAGAVSDPVRDEITRVLSGGSALPSGTTPDLAFATVDNRTDAPTRGYQVVNVGTFDGAYETLTNPGEAYRDVDPLLSPDGRRLVFTRFSDTGDDADFYVIDVAVGAGSTRRLFDLQGRFGDTGGCVDDELTWSPSGNQLAFVCYRQDDSGFLPSRAYVADMRGRTTRVALPGSADTEVYGLAYSPDGSELALAVYDPNETDETMVARIVTVDPTDPTAGPTRTVATVPLDQFDTAEAAGRLSWSADGTTIVGEWGNSPFSRRLLVVDVDTGSATLRLSEAEHEVVGVTDDGSRALVITNGDVDLLRLVATSGSGATTIADGSVLEHGQIWTASVDGDRVVFDDLDGQVFANAGNVWTSRLDASQRTRLFDVDGVINASPSLNPQRSSAMVDERD